MNPLDDPVGAFLQTFSRKTFTRVGSPATQLFQQFAFTLPALKDIDIPRIQTKISKGQYPDELGKLPKDPLFLKAICEMADDPRSDLKPFLILLVFVGCYVERNPDSILALIPALISLTNSNYSLLTAGALQWCFRFGFSNFEPEKMSILYDIYIQFCENCPKTAMEIQYIFGIALRALVSWSRNGGGKLNSYLSFLVRYVQKQQDLIDPRTAADLIYPITDMIVKLDVTVLNLFLVLSPCFSHELAVSLGSLLPAPVNYFIESTTPNLVIDDISEWEPVKLPPVMANANVKYEMIQEVTFARGLNVQTTPGLPDKPTVESLMRTDLLDRVAIIAESVRLQNSGAEIFGLFSISLKQANQSYFLDGLSVLLMFFRHWKISSLSRVLWDVAFNSVVMDERINFLLPNHSVDVIGKFRSLLFDSLAFDGFLELEYVLTSLAAKPGLVAEAIDRILGVYDQIDVNVLKKSRVIQWFATMMIYFQTIHRKSEPELVSFIEISRSKLFLFLTRILRTDNLTSTWFAHESFCSTFFSLVFEKPVRSFILSQARSCIVEFEHIDLNVIETIKTIVVLETKAIPATDAVVLLCDLIELINTFISHRRSQAYLFVDLCDESAKGLAFLTNTPECSVLLTRIIRLFASLGTSKMLRTVQMNAIALAINRVQGDNPTRQITADIIQIIAGAPLSTTFVPFSIQQPKGLKLLFKVFQNSDSFIDILSFIHTLVDYSFHNSVMANKSAFDLYLLEAMNDLKMDTKNHDVICKMLEIFTHISSLVSSGPVAQKVITLLCPVNSVLSPFQPLFLKSITQIVTSTLRMPTAWLPITTGMTRIAFDGLTKDLLGDDYVIFLWVYLDDRANTQSNVQLFELVDRKDRGIGGFVSAGSFFFVNSKKTIESTARFDKMIPTSVWTPIVIAVKMKDGKMLVQTLIDNEISRRLEFDWRGFKPGPIHGFVGPKSGKSDEPTSLFLSSFTILPGCNDVNTEVIVDEGPRKSCRVDNSLISIIMEDHNGTLDIGLRSSIDGVTAVFDGPPVNCQTSFCDVLLALNKAHTLLPLFWEINLPTIDGSRIPELPELSLDLLLTVLLANRDIQLSFAANEGFTILSHLLGTSEYFRMTYPIYVRLYSLLPMIDPSLHKSLLRDILTDFGLLFTCDIQVQIRIVKHWNRVVVLDYTDLFCEVKKFTSLLYVLDAPTMRNEVLRRSLWECAANVARHAMTGEDLHCLVSYAISADSHGNERALDVLDCLKSIISDCSSRIFTLTEHFDLFVILNLIMKVHDVPVFLKFMELVSLGSVVGLFTQMNLDLVIRELPSFYIQEDVLLGVTNLVNSGSADLIPFCCYLCLNDDFLVDLFIDNFEPSVLSPYSKFWLLYLAIKSARDQRLKLFNLILRCKGIDYLDLALTLEAVCCSCKLNFGLMGNDFLVQIYEFVTVPDADRNSIDKFFQIAAYFLLYKGEMKTSALKSLFLASPFAEARVKVKRSVSIATAFDQMDAYMDLRSRSMTMSGLYQSSGPSMHLAQSTSFDKLNQLLDQDEEDFTTILSNENDHISDSPFKFYQRIDTFAREMPMAKIFGLRKAKNGGWLDKNIALMCLNLFERWLDPLYIGFDLLLCCYLWKSGSASRVESHLSAISLSQSQKKAYSKLLNLLKYITQLQCDTLPATPLMSAVQAMSLSVSEVIRDCETLVKILHRIVRTFSKQNRALEASITQALSVRTSAGVFFFDRFTYQMANHVKVEREARAKSWSRFWRQMTVELAPWEASAASTSETTFYRDSTLCAYQCPFKLCRKVQVRLDGNCRATDHSWECIVVNLGQERKAILRIHRPFLSIIYDQRSRTITGDSIKRLTQGKRFHRQSVITLYLYNGKSYVIDFQTEKLSAIYRELCQLASEHETVSPNKTKMWACGEITNFEYLMYLNYVGNRSFKDITQYPIFPWVVSDYESPVLDLDKTDVFRDLRKSMPALNEERLSQIRGQVLTGLETGPMSPSTVVKFMQRVDPFSSLCQEVEPFTSIAEEYHKATNDIGDYRELIPEFFFFPEFLGDDVVLPKWAESPIDFIYKHRKALESDFISYTLHHWIDMVFGYRQRGPASISANNNYAEFMYDTSILKGPDVEPLIRKHGQMPLQLFTSPHKERNIEVKATIPTPIPVNTNVLGVAFGACKSNTSNSTIDVMLVARVGWIYRFTLAINEGQQYHLTPLGSVSLSAKNIPPGDDMHSNIIQCGDNSLAVTNGDAFSVHVYDFANGGKEQSLRVPFGVVKGLAADGDYLITVGSDMMTRVWRQGKFTNAVYCIPSFREVTMCAAVSVEFQTFVSATRDGTLQICSLNGGDVQMVVRIGGNRVPSMIRISPKWGFILVYTQMTQEDRQVYELFLYTINGKLIRSVQVNDIVCFIDMWSDRKGMDHCAIALKDGKVYAFELYYLDLKNLVHRSPCPIIGMNYLEKLHCLAVVGKSGAITITPLPDFVL